MHLVRKHLLNYFVQITVEEKEKGKYKKLITQGRTKHITGANIGV